MYCPDFVALFRGRVNPTSVEKPTGLPPLPVEVQSGDEHRVSQGTPNLSGGMGILINNDEVAHGAP